MQHVKCVKSGRRRTVGPSVVIQDSSSYTPSFVERKEKTRKRSTVHQGDTKENLTNLSRQASGSLPNIYSVSQDLRSSPNMNRRVTPTHNVGRRSFLGFSNGPVTSSSSSSSSRRRPVVSPKISLDASAAVTPPAPATASPVIRAGDKNFDFFDPSVRPSAPVRADRVISSSDQRTKHSATNHMSLDNWLKSLPDTLTRDNSAQNKIQPELVKTNGVGHSNKEMQVDEIEDCEDEEDASSGCIQSQRIVNRIRPRPAGAPITLEMARDLKMLMFGQVSSMFPAGWLGQAWVWNSSKQLSYGLVQHRGGPCGVMAAVQARLLQVLIHGSAQFNISACDPDHLQHGLSDHDRNTALVAAMCEALVRIGADSGEFTVSVAGMRKHFSSAGKLRADGITETLNLYKFDSAQSLFDFMMDSLGFLTGGGNNSVICFLYSCLLTRGLDNIRADMDSRDTHLMAAHGYCSQEMVNLITTGLATSNVFDDDVELGSGDDTTLLKGVKTRSDVGLLSLFEHYKSCTVGSNLKCPVYNIWLICSESHFTVLWRSGDHDTVLELGYYDGLSGQDKPILLTVDTDNDDDQEVVSSIEMCIRTKWTNARINWNGAEKIL